MASGLFVRFPGLHPTPRESKSRNFPNRIVDRPKGALAQALECIFAKASGAIRETSQNRELKRDAQRSFACGSG
jgi:hypothetical protein